MFLCFLVLEIKIWSIARLRSALIVEVISVLIVEIISSNDEMERINNGMMVTRLVCLSSDEVVDIVTLIEVDSLSCFVFLDFS